MKSLATLLVGSALAFSANASTISYSFNNPLETTEISQEGFLGLFDSALGTLTGISMIFTGAHETSLTLTSSASQVQTVSATSTTNLNFSSGLGALNALILTANPVITLSSTALQSLNPGDAWTSGSLVDGRSIIWAESAFENIKSSFIQSGGGEFLMTCTSLSGLSVSGGGGNVASTQNTSAGCGATITYTYEGSNIPEPATALLSGLGLVGLSVFGRPKKKS